MISKEGEKPLETGRLWYGEKMQDDYKNEGLCLCLPSLQALAGPCPNSQPRASWGPGTRGTGLDNCVHKLFNFSEPQFLPIGIVTPTSQGYCED